MAVADQLNPDRYNRILDDSGDDRIPASNRRRGLRWLWLWPIAAAVVFWWAGWGWGSSGGWLFGHNRVDGVAAQRSGQNSGTRASAEIKQQEMVSRGDIAKEKTYTTASGADIVASREKVIYIGKRFQATGIPIQRRVNGRVLWIGQGTPMLAVVNGTPSAAERNAAPGRDVNATGMVRQAPSPDQAKQRWGLSDEDMAQLEQQGAYVELSHLTIP
jgi:hypothetical protein